MGDKLGVPEARARLIYAHNGELPLVSKPIEGAPAPHVNGGTSGFAVSGGEQAQAAHAGRERRS